MEEGLQEEPVEYGVLMPSPQLTQQVASQSAGTVLPLFCVQLEIRSGYLTL